MLIPTLIAVLLAIFLILINDNLKRINDSVSALKALKGDVKLIIEKLNVLEARIKIQGTEPLPFQSDLKTDSQTIIPEIELKPEPKAEVQEETIIEEVSIPDYLAGIKMEPETGTESINREAYATTFFGETHDQEVESATGEKSEDRIKKKAIDLEKYIGENVINKIGIGILVIGIGFFVKYAIDKNWINETFRTLIGILCGAILLGFAHRLREKFKAFSSVLVGGGLAVFYLTIAIAFHQYQLFSQPVAFGIMVAITLLAIWLSLIYNRKEIAVLALLGGFGTPFFLSNGSGNYITLFNYILILDIGMLVLAIFRKWPLINIISYVLTVITYTIWFMDAEIPVVGANALIFATAFYLVFFLMNIVYNLRQIKRFNAFDYGILLSNSFLYYWVGMGILSQINQAQFQGLFTGGLSLFNFIFAFILFRNQKADKSFVYMLIGLVVAFISLAGPVQLNGNYITMYWATEAVLLLWLSQKNGIGLLKLGSVIITGLMALSLAITWIDVYSIVDKPLTVLINKGFITGLYCMIALRGSLYFIKKEQEMFLPGLLKSTYQYLLIGLFGIMLYMVPLLEIVKQVRYYDSIVSEQNMIIFLYHLVFVIAAGIYFFRKKNPVFNSILAIAGFVCIFLYMTLYRFEIMVVTDYLYDVKSLTFFDFYRVHIFVLIGTIFLLIWSNRMAFSVLKDNQLLKNIVYIFTTFSIVYMASQELYHFVNCLVYKPGNDNWVVSDHVSKIGFPIVWGICGFIFIRAGLVRKNKTLRIISLVLLLVTVLKLFFFDISNASEIGKIIAFICLGIVLLVISFMYQKIRNLIFKDDIKI